MKAALECKRLRRESQAWDELEEPAWAARTALLSTQEEGRGRDNIECTFKGLVTALEVQERASLEVTPKGLGLLSSTEDTVPGFGQEHLFPEGQPL